MTLEQTRRILAQLRESKENLSQNLLTGKASDYSDYRRMVGVGEGLDLAENLIREITHDDDD